jgi:predicted Fe-Mo cluster-binding NifX family protein
MARELLTPVPKESSQEGPSMNTSKTVAIACSSAQGLAGTVSGHFGHTPYFVVAEIKDQEILSSTLVASPGHGEGCNMPAFVQGLGATAIIVGGIGAGAVNGLAARGIQVVAGASGNAGSLLASFARGALESGAPGCQAGAHGHGAGQHACGHHHGHAHR